MKQAVYIGGFCPLHRGHLDVIMRAKKENDKLNLIVYSYDNEPRIQELGITDLEKYRIISEYFKGDEQISVRGVFYKDKPDWERLIQETIMKIKRDNNCELKDIIFYTGEPIYHQFLVNHGINCVFVNTCIGTNGTNIRQHPYNYMDYVAEPFKQCFKKTILLTGTSCEGKTTCARDLSRYFNAGYVPEYSREYVEKMHLTFAQCCKPVYIKSFIKHQISNISIASNKSLLVFTESDAITNLSYAKMTLEIGKLRENKYLELKQLAHQLQPKFSKVFLFAPHEKFKDDNIRTMAVSYEFRKRHFEVLSELYNEIDQKYEVLSGTYLQNFELIKNSL